MQRMIFPFDDPILVRLREVVRWASTYRPDLIKEPVDEIMKSLEYKRPKKKELSELIDMEAYKKWLTTQSSDTNSK